MRWLREGGWYFALTIISVGLFAWVPFLHGAQRLGWPRWAVVRAVVFGAGMVTILALPDDGSLAYQTLGGISMFIMAAVGCVLQVPLRRQVFFGERPEPAEPPVDPALARALAARARREQARELLRKDPLLAKDLHIGRPDLGGDYDDGGLVDLGSAPATVIAEVCGVEPSVAEAIVALREGPIGLHSVDDVFALTETPLSAWDRIRDRAVLLG